MAARKLRDSSLFMRLVRTEIAPSLLFSTGEGHARVSSIFATKKFSSVSMIDYLWIFFFIDRFVPAFSL